MALNASSSSSAAERATLGWIAAEAGAALSAAGNTLLDPLLATPAQRTAEAPAMQQARLHLRRARQAIGVAPLPELEVVFDAIEALCAALDAERVDRREAVLALTDAFQAVSGYLGQLQDGTPQQGLRLTPYYCALRRLTGDAPAATSEQLASALFFPDLARLATLPAHAPGTPLAPANWRACFEQGLLCRLTGRAPAPDAVPLADVLASIASLQDDAGRGRWTALQAFAELADAGRTLSREDKRLLGLIHAQLRRLPEQAWPDDASVRTILFALAGAPALPPLAQQVAAHCGLADVWLDDLQQRRYTNTLDYPATGELNVARPVQATPILPIAPIIAPPAAAGAQGAAPLQALADDLEASLAALLEDSRRPLDHPPAMATPVRDDSLHDSLDPARLPALLEHGGAMLTEIGHYLKTWRQHPDDVTLAPALTTQLCALQEYASSAGALRLTLALYELELPITSHLTRTITTADAAMFAQLFDDLLAQYTDCMHLFEQLPRQ